MDKITRTSIVTLHHKIGFTDGTVLEDTFAGEPLTYRLGRGEMADGLELGLLGLHEGDEQTLDIGPDLAFGFPDENLVQSLERSEFDPQKHLEVGLIIEFSTPTGETLPGTILEFDDSRVKVDFNHPLAGHTVRYRVRIVNIDNTDCAPESIN